MDSNNNQDIVEQENKLGMQNKPFKATKETAKPSSLSHNSPKKSSLKKAFNIGFWGIILLFIVVYIFLFLYGTLNKDDKALEQARNYQLLSSESLQQISPIIAQSYQRLSVMDYPDELKQEISDAIDKAFIPVYANVSKFADIHYSVKGSYTELVAYASSNLTDAIQDTLFKGFDYSVLSSQINHHLINTLDLMASQSAQQEMENVQIPLQDKKVFNEIIHNTIKKQILGFRSVELIGYGAAGGAAPVVGGAGIIAKRLANKIAVKLSSKMLTKLAAKKIASVAATTGVGALSGSSVPVVGTFLGGVLGAVVGWVTVDSAFIAVDEFINRDEFEQDLRDLITEQKNQLKADLMQQMEQIKKRLADVEIKFIKNKTPYQILKSSAPKSL